ncbi:MAG: D-alanyl-D-alanine carboxypeptidase [Clostridiaceae bacterium]|nr:D-alanyl-D-alanine carboxypeptidase [Clostridiaceae bacterium]
MKKISILIILPILLLFSCFQVSAETLSINASSYILIDSKTGQVLKEFNPDEKFNPASTTKIMTGILALENGNPDQLMTVSQTAIDGIGPGGMHIGLMVGEQLELKHLLHALLVQSANETAYVIAEHIAPTKEEFCDLMNEKAIELGALNTHFVNPCGIDNGKIGDSHLTTARDLAIMARHAMTLPNFREIVSKTTYTIPPTNKHPNEVTINTTNRLLTYGRYKSDYYDRVTGIKTGYTDKAGHNLVSSAENSEGVELIAVVMGVREGIQMVFDYSKELLEYGFKNYSMNLLVSENETIERVLVSEATGNPYLDVIASDSFECLLPNNITNISDEVEMEVTINENVAAPVNEGDVLGFMEFKRNGLILGKVDLKASRSVEKLIVTPSPAKTVYNTMNDPIFKKVTLVCSIVLILFIGLRFTLRKISRTIYSKKN